LTKTRSSSTRRICSTRSPPSTARVASAIESVV
jgi:hypothetical protein